MNWEIIEEIKRMDKIRDEWSHRRLVTYFAELIQTPTPQHKFVVILRPKCPLCGKEWREKRWQYTLYNERKVERQIQAWVSSIMARHFRVKHSFSMRKFRGTIDVPNSYQCPKCNQLISGLLHAIAHSLAHSLDEGEMKRTCRYCRHSTPPSPEELPHLAGSVGLPRDKPWLSSIWKCDKRKTYVDADKEPRKCQYWEPRYAVRRQGLSLVRRRAIKEGMR